MPGKFFRTQCSADVGTSLLTSVRTSRTKICHEKCVEKMHLEKIVYGTVLKNMCIEKYSAAVCASFLICGRTSGMEICFETHFQKMCLRTVSEQYVADVYGTFLTKNVNRDPSTHRQKLTQKVSKETYIRRRDLLSNQNRGSLVYLYMDLF